MNWVYAFSSIGIVSLTLPSVASAQPHVDEKICTPHVEAVFSDGHRLVSGGLAPVVHAVQRELRRIGVEMTWVKNDESATTAALRVILLPHRAHEWSRSRETLGAVLLEEASPSSIFVFYPAVIEALGDPANASSILGGPSRLDWSKGTARIIVHEMVHFLLPDRPHDDSGLFVPSLKARILFGPHLELEAETRRALISRVCSPASRGPGG